jgi:hypothetical protein
MRHPKQFVRVVVVLTWTCVWTIRAQAQTAELSTAASALISVAGSPDSQTHLVARLAGCRSAAPRLLLAIGVSRSALGPQLRGHFESSS